MAADCADRANSWPAGSVTVSRVTSTSAGSDLLTALHVSTPAAMTRTAATPTAKMPRFDEMDTPEPGSWTAFAAPEGAGNVRS